MHKMEPPSFALFKANRTQQNKGVVANKKQYEDEKDLTAPKTSDTLEVKELRNKLKNIMNKLVASKKEKQLVSKQNKALQEEIITLQINLRQMVPGFANTSSSFPIQNQLINKVNEFYKQECLDKFFDLLLPQISIKGILFFFTTSFKSMNKLIWNYIGPALDSLQNVGCFTTLQGPIMNVLRKSFQSNYKQIMSKMFQKQKLQEIVTELQNPLALRQKCKQVNEQIRIFLQRLGQLIVFSVFSDPPFEFDIESMQSKVSYNSLKNEAFDGFIKPKEECWIILPQLRKVKDGQMCIKSQVLQTSYN